MTSHPCRDWTGHVIVTGLRGVGMRAVEQLTRAGVRVVVIDDDPDPQLARVVAAWEVPHLPGGTRLRDTLVDAGLPGATALICAEGSDLRTLEAALLARELRPDVRVVLQMRNAAVGRAVASVTGPASVLDVAGLTAPAVIEACLKTGAHQVDVAGVEMYAVQVTARTGGQLWERFGALAPVAVVSHGEVEVCPSRDASVDVGDVVTLIGTPEDFRDKGIAIDLGKPLAVGTSRLARSWNAARHLVASLASEADRALRRVLLGLLLLIAASSVVIHIGYRGADRARLDWLDSIYFTAETVATVGFGDFSFARQPQWLEIYGIGLIAMGALLLTTTFALVTNLLVSRRIEAALGRQRATRMRGHVVVVGLGSIGLRVVEGLLARGRPVVVVERDEDNRYLAQARALGVPVLLTDGTLRQTWQAANLARASAVAVLTSDDLVNIESALVAREELADRRIEVPVVLRVFDRHLGKTVARSFGFRNVRSTSALAAPWFVGAALGLDIVGTFYVEGEPFLVGRLQVAEGGGLAGGALRDLEARIRVLAISRGTGSGPDHRPRRETKLEPGDEVWLVGPYDELLRVLRRERQAVEATAA